MLKVSKREKKDGSGEEGDGQKYGPERQQIISAVIYHYFLVM